MRSQKSDDPGADRSVMTSQDPYGLFSQINGNHSFKRAVPGGFVDYQARVRRGGKVAFFNFELAKEMGLIPTDHAHELTPKLSAKLLDTFALVIINEWDIQHRRKFSAQDIKPNRYMATRYLQLQHPCKKGTTSGDGRGIWNGEFKAKGITWDISSSGTGATCLSPACAIQKKFFRTGDPRVAYGSGYNAVDDGFNTALMSEIFYLNGIPTERTLTIIEFPGGTSINVRAARNLLRPSHFFHHLKQGNFQRLKGVIDHFVDRQIANGEWQLPATGQPIYGYFAEQMALSFSRLAALFETEYIFCWMEWDGDNILADAGIIDYGSVRQFGLFHDEYRYDDVDRFSTKLTEQKNKARYMVQAFAQIRDFLTTGQKKNIRTFAKDPILKLFDENFERLMDELLLRRVGLEARDRRYLLEHHAEQVKAFRRVYAHFERTQSSRGIYTVSDGVQSDAIFCMHDCLRELPKHYLRTRILEIGPQGFLDLIKSSYARKRDLSLGAGRIRRIREFQKRYVHLLETVAKYSHQGKLDQTLLSVTMRSSVINRCDRITGDGIIRATEAILKLRKTWSQSEIQALVERFVHTQVLDPARQKAIYPPREKQVVHALEKVQQIVLELREGI